MSSIAALTSGRLALALGAVGIGALVGGAVADHKGGDVGRGLLVGGASGLAGAAMLLGGHSLWRHFNAAKAGAAQLGTLSPQLQHTMTSMLDDAARASILTPPVVGSTAGSSTFLQTLGRFIS
jgi:hypothetical protein